MLSAELSKSRAGGPVVVLTFDDGGASHLEFVAPLLAERGFGATFFVTRRWMDDQRFLSWEGIAAIHRLGFEIGNHSWSHGDFSTSASACSLDGELARVERALHGVGVPRPTSFAWTGNAFGPEALNVLERRGYVLARRGMQPEIRYGECAVGPTYETTRHHPLLIPTTGDSYPDWTLEHFRSLLDAGRRTGIVILQFHGVPDVAHPWVSTSADMFLQYVDELERAECSVHALRDLLPLLPTEPPNDAMVNVRYTTEP